MKILQADDHKLFRDGVGMLLRSIDDSIEILESEDFVSTDQTLERHPECDLLLLDLDMPGMHGLNGLRSLTQSYPSLPIIVLSAAEHRLDISHAMELGAAGFVSKSSPTDILWSAIQLVLAGGIYFPQPVKNELTARESWPSGSRITPRQVEILDAISRGLSNNAIADHLNLSESTVKGHINSILRTLEVENRVQAINRAQALGILGENSS